MPGCWSAPPNRCVLWTRRSCGRAGSTTSSRSGRRTPRPAPPSGPAISGPPSTPWTSHGVEASELFTPADIEFAARKGAQAAFEREVTHRQGEPATTEDYLTAIADTRPTLTARAIRSSPRTSRSTADSEGGQRRYWATLVGEKRGTHGAPSPCPPVGRPGGRGPAGSRTESTDTQPWPKSAVESPALESSRSAAGSRGGPRVSCGASAHATPAHGSALEPSSPGTLAESEMLFTER